MKKKSIQINKQKSTTKTSGKKVKKKIVIKTDKKPLKKTISKTTKVRRVSTGVINLDKITEGGFEKNSTNLIVGGTGSGKSILAIQFLIEGIKKGEYCLYITFEEGKKEFFDNVKGIGWDLEQLEKNGRFFFIEYSPSKVKTMLEEGGGAIESLVLRKKITRIVIDSMTSFILLFERDIEKRKAALSLFDILRKWDCTTLLTYEVDSYKGEKKLDTLEFESDSIILLYFLRNKKERKRYLEVLKMRGTKHSNRIYSFSIDKRGIAVSAKPSSEKIEI